MCSARDISGNSGGGGADAPDPRTVLSWLLAKEESELSDLKNQSSTWFFFESCRISDINVNVTISLSSGLLKGGAGADGTADASAGEAGGRPGFQLLNVTNVPIQLAALAIDNMLCNKVSLSNKVWQHYMWQFAFQARKVRSAGVA